MIYPWILHSTSYTTGVHNRCYCRLSHWSISSHRQNPCTNCTHSTIRTLQMSSILQTYFQSDFWSVFFCKYYIYTMSAVISTSEKILLKSTILIKNTHTKTLGIHVFFGLPIWTHNIYNRKENIEFWQYLNAP